MKPFIYSSLITFLSCTQVSLASAVYDLTPFHVYESSGRWDQNEYVGSQELGIRPPLDLAESLANSSAGLSFFRKGPVAHDLQIRGMGRNNVDIQIDGANIFCACPNRMDPPAFHAGTRQVERIRITNGPFDVESIGTLAGSVEVETILPTQTNHGSFHAGAGGFGYRYGALSLRGPVGGVPLLGDVTWQRGLPYEDGNGVPFTEVPGGMSAYQAGMENHRAFEIWNLLGKAVLMVGPGNLRHVVTAGYDHKADILYPALAMDTIEGTTERFGWSSEQMEAGDLLESWEMEMHYASVDHNMSDRYRISSTSDHPMWMMMMPGMQNNILARGFFMRTLADSQSFDIKWKGDLLLSEWENRFGVEYLQRQWDADNQVGMNSNSMIPDVKADRYAAFAKTSRRWDDWLLDAGLRLGYIQSKARDSLAFLESLHGPSDSSPTATLPGGFVMLTHKLNESVFHYTGLGYATRAPDPQELFMQLDRPMANSDWVGNPELDTVKLAQLETGFRWNLKSVEFDFSVFYSETQDYVYLDDLAATPVPVTSYENIDIQMWGWQSSVNWSPSETFAVRWIAGMQRARKKSGTDRDVAEIPPLSSTLLTVWKPTTAMTFRLEGEGALHQDNVDESLGETETAGWWQANLRFSWAFSENGEFGLEIENLFDRPFRRHLAYLRDPFRSGPSVNEPGRQLIVRIGWNY